MLQTVKTIFEAVRDTQKSEERLNQPGAMKNEDENSCIPFRWFFRNISASFWNIERFYVAYRTGSCRSWTDNWLFVPLYPSGTQRGKETPRGGADRIQKYDPVIITLICLNQTKQDAQNHVEITKTLSLLFFWKTFLKLLYILVNLITVVGSGGNANSSSMAVDGNAVRL